MLLTVQAKIARAEFKLETSIQLLEAALNRYPTFLPTLLLLSETLIEHQEYERAYELLSPLKERYVKMMHS